MAFSWSQFFSGNLEQIFLEFWQLTGSPQALHIDQVWHICFGVAMLLCVNVQHQLRKRAMEACKSAGHQTETRTAEFRGGGKIEQTQTLANTHVIPYRKIEGARRSPAAHFPIIG